MPNELLKMPLGRSDRVAHIKIPRWSVAVNCYAALRSRHRLCWKVGCSRLFTRFFSREGQCALQPYDLFVGSLRRLRRRSSRSDRNSPPRSRPKLKKLDSMLIFFALIEYRRLALIGFLNPKASVTAPTWTAQGRHGVRKVSGRTMAVASWSDTSSLLLIAVSCS